MAHPELFLTLLLLCCITSLWKINLPIALVSGSTLSVSYAANLMSLLLLGTWPATIIAAIGVWVQCTNNVKRPYPLHRTIFSICAQVVTMIATAYAYHLLGGTHADFGLSLARPLVGAIFTYFVVNTGLIAAAIAYTTRRSPIEVWRTDFLWSAASFFVAGAAGAAGAVLVDRGQVWVAVLMLAPVYLTYSTYRVFVGRLEDQRRHRERLGAALEAMTRLKEQRHELLQREQAARSIAEQANRLKDQFLAIVSHELRTPLNAILGWSDMLQMGHLDAERRRRAVRAIYDSGRRQAQIIDDLLDLSRITSGRLKLERAGVDWHEVIRAAVEMARPAAEGKDIHLDVDVDPDIGPFTGDQARLQQVVWNLLTNSVKFTSAGGCVRVRLYRGRDDIELTVSDTGEGIAPELLEAVFEPFRQADGSSTRRHGGLGLGLSIVKQLVEAHGGRISADSAGRGQGSRFTVSLPLVSPMLDVDRTDPSAISGADPLVTSPSLRGVRVLVVDDDEAGREVVSMHLQARHATVVDASSATEALDLLRRERFDVLLVDIAMPEHDGYELIQTIRSSRDAEWSRVPAAALTAFARDEDQRRSFESGFQLHLTKPIDAATLVEAVASLRSQAAALT